jgi:hypothetical protein
MVLVLPACSSDSTDTTATGVSENAEVEQVLADYQAAWAEGDVDAFLDIVTDDYTFIEANYQQFADEFDVTPSTRTKDAAAETVESNSWQFEHVGEPLIVGDGPWFVTVGDNWTGGNELWVYNGTGTYGIIDEGGGLKIATAYWVGLQTRPADYTPGS